MGSLFSSVPARRKVRIYLKSGAVIKIRTRQWTQTKNRFTGELTEAEWSWPWWTNRRQFHIKLDQIDAIVLSRW